MSEVVALVAVLGAVLGAGLNSIRAWWDAPDTVNFSKRKFFGTLVAGALAALAVVNFVDIGADGPGGAVALFITHVVIGAGASLGLGKALSG